MTTSPSEPMSRLPHSADPMVGISVSMRVSMLVALDEKARHSGMSRSEFIRRVIEATLTEAPVVRADTPVPRVPEPMDAGPSPHAFRPEGPWPEGT